MLLIQSRCGRVNDLIIPQSEIIKGVVNTLTKIISGSEIEMAAAKLNSCMP